MAEFEYYDKMARLAAKRDGVTADVSADLRPDLDVAVKLASIAVHADEALSPGRHDYDLHAISGLLADPGVKAYLERLGAMALLPVKR